MDEYIIHPYNTRYKKVIKSNQKMSKIDNYLKPKFIVNLSGERKITKTSEDYNIVIHDLVSLSNKLLKHNQMKQAIEYNSDSDSDYIEEKKPKNTKYIKYSKAERTYFNNLDKSKQKIIKKFEKSIKNFQNKKKPLRFKILEIETISKESKYSIIERLEHFKKLDNSDNEYFKLSNWINWLDRIPFNTFTNIDIKNNKKDVSNFLLNAKTIMDKAVYGHIEAKDQVIINMAKMITNDKSRGACIAIQGPMGNGKTTLVKEGICKALGRPFGFIALGGMQDSNFMIGHDYTYEGSKPGRIIEILAECACMNPVIYFDELDKISETSHGDEISNMLCHLTDFSQNTEFQDKYLSGVKIDLSRVIFIFSYNDESKINPILLDRMYKIRTKGFNTNDKIKIAKNYLIPNILEEYKLKNIIFTDDCIRELTCNYTEKEEGVRNLRRQIETIISKINVLSLVESKSKIIECGIDKIKFPFTVDKNNLNKFISQETESANPYGMYM